MRSKTGLAMALMLAGALMAGCAQTPKRAPKTLQAAWPSQDASLIKATRGGNPWLPGNYEVAVDYVDDIYVNSVSLASRDVLVAPGRHRLRVDYADGGGGSSGTIEADFIGGRTYRVDATTDRNTVRFILLDITDEQP